MTQTDITTHITGAVNEYYPDQAMADIGILPVWRDTMYARRSLADPAVWKVTRMTVQPLLPKGLKLPPVLAIALAISVPDNSDISTLEVSLKIAFDMVRDHEMNPPSLRNDAQGQLVLKQMRPPEDSNTHWEQLKID